VQYYQKALLEAQEGGDPEARSARLQERIVAYRAQLAPLLPLLSESGCDFFQQINLRGGLLLAFSFGDGLDTRRHNLDAFDETYRRLRAELQVLSAGRDAIYTLRYTTLRLCTVDAPAGAPDTEGAPGPLGDWQYDELTDAGEAFFRHEIQFVSGATVLLEFRHFSYRKEVV